MKINKSLFNKTKIDTETFECLHWCIDGGEFFTKTEIIDIYLKPLYSEEDLLNI